MGVSVVIVDQFGVIIYYYRADGQGKANTETALMKAKTVLNTRQPSKAQMNAVRSGANSEARVISFGNFANAGALPIIVDGQFLGAIGVGGMAAQVPVWSDEICAHQALTAVLGPQPALLPDLPNPYAVSNNPASRAARRRAVTAARICEEAPCGIPRGAFCWAEHFRLRPGSAHISKSVSLKTRQECRLLGRVVMARFVSLRVAAVISCVALPWASGRGLCPGTRRSIPIASIVSR